jgi:hypothetical protein
LSFQRRSPGGLTDTRPAGRALEFVDRQSVVAFGGQDLCHAPGGVLIAVIIQDPGDRPP